VVARRTCQCCAVGCADAKHGPSEHVATAITEMFCSTRKYVVGHERRYPRGVAGFWQVSNSQMTVLCDASTQHANTAFKPLADQSDGSFDDERRED
jgi:hypothetical protein